MPDTTVEVRCPLGPRKLFTKLKLGEEFARTADGNLLEFTCGDCSRRIGRERGERVRVYHQFNFLGELIRTMIEAV
jgi:hypothetical protein